MIIVIIDLGKNHQQMLKPLVKDYWETSHLKMAYQRLFIITKGNQYLCNGDI